MRAVISVGLRKLPVEHRPALEAARRLGVATVLIAASPPKNLPPGLVADVRRVDPHDTASFDEVVDAVAAEHDVAGVVTWSDNGVEPAARAAARLGVPGMPVAAARSARNKFLMRSALSETAPHLIPRFGRVRTWEEALRAAERTGFPAVLKPAAGSGSKGIFLVEDRTGLRAAFAALEQMTGPGGDGIFRRDRGEMILEELLRGTEHSVEGFIHKGNVSIAGITDKTTTEPFRLEVAHLHPSELPERDREAIGELTRETVKALDFDDCAFHLECMVDPAAGPRLIEVAARAGGDCIGSHLVSLATGKSFHEDVLRVAMGLPPCLPRPPIRYAGMRKVEAHRDGILKGLGGLGAAAAVPGVVHVFPLRANGSAVALPPVDSSSSLVGGFIATGADAASVRRALETASAMVEVRMEER